MEVDHKWKLQLKQYRRYTRYLGYMNAVSGVWPDYHNHPLVIRIFLRFISMFASAAIFYGIIMFDITEAASINTFTRGLGLMIAAFSTFMKVIIFAKRQGSMRYLNQNVRSSFEQDLKDAEMHNHVFKFFPTISRFFYMFCAFTSITVSLWAFTPLYLAFFKGKYIRMFPQYLPFSIPPGSLTHWLVYGFELFCGFYLWCVSCGSDLTFGFYSLHIIGELNVLSQGFRNLKSNENYNEDLKKCITRHLMISKSVSILQKIFGFLSIWLAITCAVALCTLIFQVTQMKSISILRACYITTHIIVKLLQSYKYSWYGHTITAQSEECLHAIYESSWPESGDTKFRNDAIIILSQKPMIFNAMHFMNLGFDMFQKVLHASVSYFFLLKTLEAKDI